MSILIGECEVDEEGKVKKVVREPSWQGMIFKDEEAFLNSPKEPCYVPELDDTVYTREDFLELAEGDVEIAEALFYSVDWESPSTCLDCNLRDGEFLRCEKCGKLIHAMMEDVTVCPHCGRNTNEE